MNGLKTAVLMSIMIALCVAIGAGVAGEKGAIVMFIIALGMNFFSYWYSDSIVLKMYKAQEINRTNAPQLFDLVEKLVERAHLPMPRVYIIEADEPNAFATGRNPNHAAVAVTTGIMRALSYEELSGVLAHELSHIKHRDTLISTIAGSLAGFISLLANIAQFSMIFEHREREGGSNPIVLLATVIIAPIAAMIIQMAISRSREYAADEEGGKICGNPNYLASALQKIDYYAKHGVLPNAKPETAHMFIISPLSGKSMASLFSTHPATDNRIEKLHEQARAMGIHY